MVPSVSEPGGEESLAGNRSALGLCKSLFVQDKIKVPSILSCTQFYALQENKSATECLCGMLLLLFSLLKFCTTSQSCQFAAQRISQLQKKRHRILKKGDGWGSSFHINPGESVVGRETPELMRCPRATPQKVDVTEEIKEGSGWRSQGGQHPALSHIQWESEKGGRAGLTLESCPFHNIKLSHNLSTPRSSSRMVYASSCEK